MIRRILSSLMVICTFARRSVALSCSILDNAACNPALAPYCEVPGASSLMWDNCPCLCCTQPQASQVCPPGPTEPPTSAPTPPPPVSPPSPPAPTNCSYQVRTTILNPKYARDYCSKFYLTVKLSTECKRRGSVFPVTLVDPKQTVVAHSCKESEMERARENADHEKITNE